MSTSDFSPGHRALPRIFANPKESQPAEITQLLFQSGSKHRKATLMGQWIPTDVMAVGREIPKWMALLQNKASHDRMMAVSAP
jgi:hypothetical protein